MSHMERQNFTSSGSVSENRRPSPDLPGTSGLMQQSFSAMKIQRLFAWPTPRPTQLTLVQSWTAPRDVSTQPICKDEVGLLEPGATDLPS